MPTTANSLFTFHLDVELPNALMQTVNIHMLHPEIVKGFTNRKCDTLGLIYSNSRFVYAKQLNGMYTRASISEY